MGKQCLMASPRNSIVTWIHRHCNASLANTTLAAADSHSLRTPGGSVIEDARVRQQILALFPSTSGAPHLSPAQPCSLTPASEVTRDSEQFPELVRKYRVERLAGEGEGGGVGLSSRAEFVANEGQSSWLLDLSRALDLSLAEVSLLVDVSRRMCGVVHTVPPRSANAGEEAGYAATRHEHGQTMMDERTEEAVTWGDRKSVV